MTDTDEVDEIVAGWAAARPGVDLEPLQVLSRVQRIAQLLSERREQAFAEHGLAGHEFDVLAALRRVPSELGLTPGRLVTLTHVTSGTMTNRLDRLEARRLIVRRPHPDDGRQTLVRLTAAGRRRVDGALDSLLSYERSVLDGLSARELRQTVGVLRTLLAAGNLGAG